MIGLFNRCVLNVMGHLADMFQRLLLKQKIVLKSVLSSGTRVGPEWIKELQWEKVIEL